MSKNFCCCPVKDDNGKRWFVSFDTERSTMVVTDAMMALYEKEMSLEERIRFAGNVAEHMLKEAWLQTTVRKNLQITDITDDELTLVRVVERIKLNRVKDVSVESMQKRVAEMLDKVAHSHLYMLGRYGNDGYTLHMVARKTMPVPESQRADTEKRKNGSATDPSKRRRTRPTGLGFDDQ